MCIAIYLADYISRMSTRKYSYRFVFVPENIGAMIYIDRHLQALKKNMIAGFNLSCLGDDRAYSIVRSRYGSTLADKALLNILNFTEPSFREYPFTGSGSDERRYNAPFVDLPVVGFSRSLYGE